MNFIAVFDAIAPVIHAFSRYPWENHFRKPPMEMSEMPPPPPEQIAKPIASLPKQKAPKMPEQSMKPSEYSGTSQVTQAGKACIPCGSDHFSTVSGELSEAMRFARVKGVSSIAELSESDRQEILTRVSHSEDELNVFEREDGAPEKVALLEGDEKELMDDMLIASRNLRHALSDITTVEELEGTAAQAQTMRRDIRTRLFKLHLGSVSPKQKEQIKERALAKFKELIDNMEDAKASGQE